MVLGCLLVIGRRHARPAEIPLATQYPRTGDRRLGACGNFAAAAFDDVHVHPLLAPRANPHNVTSTLTAAPPRRAVSKASWTLSRGKRCVTSLSGCTCPVRR